MIEGDALPTLDAPRTRLRWLDGGRRRRTIRDLF